MNARFFRGGVLSALLFTLVGCGSGTVDTTSEAGKLQLARSKWDASGIRSYRFTLRRSAFTPPGYNGPATITVRDGAVVSVEGDIVKGAFDAIDTIPELFAVAQQGVETEGGTVTSSYNSDNGVPVSLYVDPIPMAADDEVGYAISDFVAL